MEKKIEIIPFLAGIIKENTRAYQTDLTFDEKRLQAAMLDPVPENRVFLWMCRPCGTWCFLERDVFLRDTDTNIAWTHPDYVAEAAQIKAYRVTVAPGLPGTPVLGELQPLDYGEQVKRVDRLALPIHQVTLFFSDGKTTPMSYGEYLDQFHRILDNRRDGTISRITYHPENEGQLSALLYMERHPPKQRSRRPKKPPVR